jgi:hypothetical protein
MQRFSNLFYGVNFSTSLYFSSNLRRLRIMVIQIYHIFLHLKLFFLSFLVGHRVICIFSVANALVWISIIQLAIVGSFSKGWCYTSLVQGYHQRDLSTSLKVPLKSLIIFSYGLHSVAYSFWRENTDKVILRALSQKISHSSVLLSFLSILREVIFW